METSVSNKRTLTHLAPLQNENDIPFFKLIPSFVRFGNIRRNTTPMTDYFRPSVIP